MRDRVIPIYSVDEDNAGVSRLPRHIYYLVKHLFGIELTGYFSGVGVYQIIVGAGLNRFHKLIGYRYREVEVGKSSGVVLGYNELHNIRVVNIKNSHIGSPPHSPLFNNIGGGVKGSHKGNGTTGNTPGGADSIGFRSQSGEGKASPATAFVNKSGILYRIKDRLHGIVNGEDKAGGQLPQLPAGIHQGRGVGQKLQVSHQLVELLFPGPDIRLGVVDKLGRGNGLCHPAEHLFWGLDNLSLAIFL